MEFVYPIKTTIPKSNPYGVLSWFTGVKDWDNSVGEVVTYISTHVVDSSGSIPIGTKLYHGSLDHDLTFSKDRITFFGIDVVISLWYILELNTKSWGGYKIGKLYEFVVSRPIPVTIINKLKDNPSENRICLQKTTACIHPQVSIHDASSSVFDSSPKDLCIELTLNMNYYRDHLVLKKTYIVDPAVLDKNKNKPFEEFNPIESIVKTNIIGGNRYKNKTRKKRFRLKKNRHV